MVQSPPFNKIDGLLKMPASRFIIAVFNVFSCRNFVITHTHHTNTYIKNIKSIVKMIDGIIHLLYCSFIHLFMQPFILKFNHLLNILFDKCCWHLHQTNQNLRFYTNIKHQSHQTKYKFHFVEVTFLKNLFLWQNQLKMNQIAHGVRV